jgi:hypothetical protein
MYKKIYILIIFLSTNHLLFAQALNTPTYYKETFTNGASKWTFKQNSNQFKWALTGKGPATSIKYPIGAVDPPLKTADNTWMLFDAFKLGTVQGALDAQIASPRYDCSDFKELYLQFTTLFRRNNANEHLYIGISTDSIKFEEKEIFKEVEEGRFCDGKQTFLKTLNPYVFTLKLDAKYANKPKIWISFHYKDLNKNGGDGNYSWQIDDIELLDHDPTPNCDLQIKDDFFAIPPFAKIPMSQLDSIPLGMDVFNNSIENKENTIFGIEIVNLATKKIVFKQEKNIALIKKQDTITNFYFPKKFLPEAEIATYRGTYYVKNTCNDERPRDNAYSFVFEVSDNVFQKERGKGTRRVSPNEDENIKDWSYGNHFYLKKGKNFEAKSISFSIDNNYLYDNENIENDSLSTSLYVWKNTNENDTAEPNELILVGRTTNVVSGSAKEFTFNLKPMLKNAKKILLEDETDYLAVIEYQNMNNPNKTMIMVVNDTLFYDAAHLASKKNEHILYNSVLKIGSDKNFFTSGFDSPMTPVVRLNIAKTSVGTEDSNNHLEQNINVFPNPTNDFIFIQNTDNQMFIEKIVVKNTLNQAITYFENENKINISTLNKGIYILEIQTNKGTFAKKIIKN